MEEIWKDIPTMEGYYQVSNIGRVRSLSRKVRTTFGIRETKEIILKTCYSTQYPSVSICINNKRRTMSIHQLMAMAFYGHIPCKFDLVINHIDGNKQNNTIDNIELVTLRYNTSDGRKRMDTSSSYTGVSFDKKSNKWRAMICLNYIDYSLGLFESEDIASQSYNDALQHINTGNFIDWYKTIFANKNKTSKYRGVCYDRSRNRYIARLVINKKILFYEYYKSEDDAAIAYENEVKKYWSMQNKFLYPKRGLYSYFNNK